jgi:Mrp family chromosome partitioning ATPase
MQMLLRDLAERYDLVLIDTAPVLAVSDTLLLLNRVDGILMVVRWAETRQDVAIAAVDQIRHYGGRLAGTILSMVDFDKIATYGALEAQIYPHVRHYYDDRPPRIGGLS